jgi:hypothetical protein
MERARGSRRYRGGQVNNAVSDNRLALHHPFPSRVHDLRVSLKLCGCVGSGAQRDLTNMFHVFVDDQP